MQVNDMTRKELEAVPIRENWHEEVRCDSVVILPGRARDLHDSGYRRMDFVAVSNGEPVCRLSACSDVVHIGGLGGYGYRWYDRADALPKRVSPVAWKVECLPESGLLQLWARGGVICGSAVSSFELWADDERAKEKSHGDDA